MKIALQLVLCISVLFYSCKTRVEEGEVEKWENEIIQMELKFSQMVEDEGIPKAFLAFAAEDAVLLRNNKLIIGKDAIKEKFQNQNAESGNVSLTWKPDFVDVSLSGDMAYTYGKYVYSSIDSLGSEHVDEGVFHTVWKRQTDGTWKFVWD